MAEAFRDAVPVTGLVLTKIDGDARGGAALSISSVTGVPSSSSAPARRTDALEVFHPDRLAGRILGMGDVLTLVERAQESFDAKEQAKLAEKLRKNQFTLDDFLEQMQQLKKMGPVGQLLDMIPGMGGMAKEAQGAVDRGELSRVEAIIRSMTPAERRDPSILNASRRRRIATRLRDDPAGRQSAGQAVRRDAEAHEAARLGTTPRRAAVRTLTRDPDDRRERTTDRTAAVRAGRAGPAPVRCPAGQLSAPDLAASDAAPCRPGRRPVYA